MNNPYCRPLVVLVDIDNVVLDTERAILDRYNKEYGKEVKFEEIDRWDFFNDKVDKDFFEFLGDNQFWTNEVKPIKPMCDYIRMMHECPEYFNIKLVTASNPLNDALQAKLKFARFETGVEPKDIIICSDKSLIHGDIMIDDSEENIKHSSCWNNWLIDKPWNKAKGYWYDVADNINHLGAPFLNEPENLYNTLMWCKPIKRITRMYVD